MTKPANFERNIPEDYRGRDGNFLGFSRPNYSQTGSLKDNLVPPKLQLKLYMMIILRNIQWNPRKVIYTYKTGVPEFEKLKVGRRDLF